jgi:hypothetical protein
MVYRFDLLCVLTRLLANFGICVWVGFFSTWVQGNTGCIPPRELLASVCEKDLAIALPHTSKQLIAANERIADHTQPFSRALV